MFLLSAFRGRTGGSGARGRRPSYATKSRSRLVIDVLEDRILPSCTLSLAPSEPAPQLVGDQVLWTATASDCSRDLVY
jgi:hypothetical protein